MNSLLTSAGFLALIASLFACSYERLRLDPPRRLALLQVSAWSALLAGGAFLLTGRAWLAGCMSALFVLRMWYLPDRARDAARYRVLVAEEQSRIDAQRSAEAQAALDRADRLAASLDMATVRQSRRPDGTYRLESDS